MFLFIASVALAGSDMLRIPVQVPEPSISYLLGIGIVGLGYIRSLIVK